LLAEGPVWVADERELWWVDIRLGHLHRLDPRLGQVLTAELGVSAGCVAPRLSGGVVAATAAGFLLLHRDGRAEQTIGIDDVVPGGRMNDGKVDGAGRFLAGWVGADGNRRDGRLLRLDPDGAVNVILADVGLANGLDWSCDGETLYFVDSQTGGIDAFDYDTRAGTLSGRRRLVDVSGGIPDGLTVDAEGDLWLAVWGAGCVRRYSAAGELREEHAFPTPNVTSCAFGGPDLGTLFVTTARSDGDDDGFGGSVFSCDGVGSGLPRRPFGG